MVHKTEKAKEKDNFDKWLIILFVLAAISVIAYIIFKYPLSGVADQGDFDRVMFGLSVLDSDANNPDFVRFYKYIVTDYSINLNLASILLIFSGSTINYLIFIVICVCKLFGQNIFKTQYLAIFYSIIYIFAVSLIIKNINLKSKFKKIFLTIVLFFILFDGYYIIWFNSLYGEPTMLTTLLLFIGSYLVYLNSKYGKCEDKNLKIKIAFVFAAAFLFFGSKMQVSTTLPFIIVLLIKIIIDNRKKFSKKYFAFMCCMLALVIVCPIKMSIQGSAQGKDTLYNSIFYGVLNESETPEQDLIDMGLNPDMACEAGKHAYLNTDEYVKYVPRTQITEDELYSKAGNSTLAKFYLTHPLRLIKGMEYTADKAFITSTSLGKHYRSYSEEPVTEFNRFTLWSSFRENNFPQKLWFIVVVFIATIGITIYEYVKKKDDKLLKNKIFLVWALILAGAIQFPMPFVGNGRADTAKQLYLFNFIFDLMIAGILCYIIFKFVDIINRKFFNTKEV